MGATAVVMTLLCGDGYIHVQCSCLCMLSVFLLALAVVGALRSYGTRAVGCIGVLLDLQQFSVLGI